jgi:DnaJ-class molecular chaperone
MAATPPTNSYQNATGELVETMLPTRWEICGSCGGDGTAGHHAIACDECHGSGRVRVIDYGRLGCGS